MIVIGRVFATLFATMALVFFSSAQADPALWQSLAKGGYVLLIRHASTEAGSGDPPGFRLDDCGTQRNLSAAGRAEAAALGAAFRAHRVPVGEVRASPWCRCLDTARLAFGTAVTPWPALSSLYKDSRDEVGQRREVIAYARTMLPGSNLVLVTHNFNIRSLVGVSPEQAEVVVARVVSQVDGDQLKLVGRLPPGPGQ